MIVPPSHVPPDSLSLAVPSGDHGDAVGLSPSAETAEDTIRPGSLGGANLSGRGDDQPATGGGPTEIGAVEYALCKLAGVEAAVALRLSGPSGEGPDQLVAFVIGTFEPSPSDRLRQALAEALPSQLVPTAILVSDAFPQTDDGDVDEAALAGVFEAWEATPVVAAEPPEGPLEQQVAALWGSLLATGEISRRDRFFALGGTSLKALLFTSRLSKSLGVDVPLSLILEIDELAGFCAACERAR